MNQFSRFLSLGYFIVFSFGLSIGAEYPYRFHRISPEGGFYHYGIRSITQDSDGFIWFNTKHEVFRFDAYNVIRSNQVVVVDNRQSVTNFLCLYNDKSSDLWLTADIGLFKYNKLSADFEFEYNFKDNITRMVEDDNGNFWLQGNNTIGIYDPEKQVFYQRQMGFPPGTSFSYLHTNGKDIFVGTRSGEVYTYDHYSGTFFQLFRIKSETRIMGIASVNDQVFALSADRGLFVYDRLGNYLKNYTFFLEVSGIQGNNIGTELFLDKNNILWIATHQGLFLLNPSTESFSFHTSKTEDVFTLPNKTIWTIYADNQNGIWVGTYSGGLAYANIFDHRFISIRHPNSTSQNNNFINSFAEDQYFNLWIGSDGGGLSYYHTEKQDFTFFRNQKNKNSLSFDNVKALAIEKDNNLWIGTYNGGLDRLNLKTKQFFNYKNDPKNSNSISGNHVYALQLEADSGIWIATQPLGLDFFHFANKTFTNFNLTPLEYLSTFSNNINGLFRGSNDRLWIATADGLLEMSIPRKKFRHFKYSTIDPQ